MPVYGVQLDLDFALSVNSRVTVRQKLKNHKGKAVNAATERKPVDTFNFIESNKRIVVPPEPERISKVRINNIEIDLQPPQSSFKTKRHSMLNKVQPSPLLHTEKQKSKVVDFSFGADDFARQTTNDMPVTNFLMPENYAYAPIKVTQKAIDDNLFNLKPKSYVSSPDQHSKKHLIADQLPDKLITDSSFAAP